MGDIMAKKEGKEAQEPVPEEKEIVDEEKLHDHVEEETGETPEEIKQEMDEGKTDEEVYTEEGREKLAEDDEISPEEEGFMEGAEDRGEQTSCAYCGAMISEDKENIFEREFEGELKVFCSEDHANKYAEKLDKEKAPKKD
jgi:hypothetical protein